MLQVYAGFVNGQEDIVVVLALRSPILVCATSQTDVFWCALFQATIPGDSYSYALVETHSHK